jgi:hypothetical protein
MRDWYDSATITLHRWAEEVISASSAQGQLRFILQESLASAGMKCEMTPAQWNRLLVKLRLLNLPEAEEIISQTSRQFINKNVHETLASYDQSAIGDHDLKDPSIAKLSESPWIDVIPTGDSQHILESFSSTITAPGSIIGQQYIF